MFELVYKIEWRLRERTGKLSLTISAKPVGVGAVCQPWILLGEHAGRACKARLVVGGLKEWPKIGASSPENKPDGLRTITSGSSAPDDTRRFPQTDALHKPLSFKQKRSEHSYVIRVR